MRFVWALVAALLIATGTAQAAGLYLAPAGAEALAQGGAAFAEPARVAYVIHNPASLAASEDLDLSLSATLSWFRTEYRRRVGGQSYPAVVGTAPLVPLPALAIAKRLRPLPLDLGLSVHTPVPALQNWPSSLDDGAPAPQRYAIENVTGSALGIAAVSLAWQGGAWSLGSSFQLLAGRLGALATVTGCDGVLCQHPEDPDYDAQVQLLSQPFAAPSLQLGALYRAHDRVVFGMAGSLGFTVDAAARARVRLPRSPIYSTVSLSPEEPKLRLRFRLPATVSLGAKLTTNLGVFRVGLSYELWSQHDEVVLSPQNAKVTQVPLLGEYALAPVRLERQFQDVVSLRAAWELDLARGPLQAILLGVLVEPSAIPDAYLSPITVDFAKALLSVSAAMRLFEWELLLTYAYGLLVPRDVASGALRQVSPIEPPWSGRTDTGSGHYEGAAHLVGVSVHSP